MIKDKNAYWLYLSAAILLMGLGIYYFLFEINKSHWWVILLSGSVFNMFLAFNVKKKEE
ncbi:hypothetical protein [Flexithrix dorotheae]|uniref:hypothetical protein n=1 Tax=Flexithrix dorotheae TaxID=70993 RepID=UPI00036A3747|nr:hypothetical protein [Flexithrix dorotheae]